MTIYVDFVKMEKLFRDEDTDTSYGFIASSDEYEKTYINTFDDSKDILNTTIAQLFRMLEEGLEYEYDDGIFINGKYIKPTDSDRFKLTIREFLGIEKEEK